MLKTLFAGLDAHPAAYWVLVAIASGLFALWLSAALRGHRCGAPSRTTDWRFALLLFALMLAWRWPVLLHPRDLNPDEGQLLAAALTYQIDPVPFRSVELTTSGPLNGLALLPLHWLGLPLDYFGARVTALLLAWATLFATYATLRSRLSPAIAALGMLPGILFLATATNTDFLHYSSEHPSIFLSALGIWLIWTGRPATRALARTPGNLRWTLGGLAIGMLPWAKLQSAPIATAIALFGVWIAWCDSRRSPAQRGGWSFSLAVAALLPSGVIIAVLAASGLLGQLGQSYIVANLGYMDNPMGWGEVIASLAHQMQRTWLQPTSLVSAALMLIGHAIWAVRGRHRPGPLYWAGAAFSVTALYAIVAPRHDFPHYLLFLVGPLTIWSAAAFGEVWQSLAPGAARRRCLITFVAVAGLLPLAFRVAEGIPEYYGTFAQSWRVPYETVGRHIRAVSRPGDRLTVWGWWTHLQVEAGLAQGTREAHSEREISPSSMRDTFFRPRYLADLERNRPLFFVDAVGPDSFGYTKRDVDGHEAYPALGDFVAANYTLVKDYGNARLYLLANQAEARHAAIPLIVPLELDTFTEKTAAAPVARLGDAPPPGPFERRFADDRTFAGLNHYAPLDFFAHAPARLVHPVPAGTLRLRGAFSIQPEAYQDPSRSSDGALFTIAWIGADGRRTLALERTINPRDVLADRPPVEFDLAPPSNGATAVELTIATGQSGAFDWTFWRALRFEAQYRP